MNYWKFKEAGMKVKHGMDEVDTNPKTTPALVDAMFACGIEQKNQEEFNKWTDYVEIVGFIAGVRFAIEEL